jgi:hypothetical protein
MRQSAKREGVLIGIFALDQQLTNEVSGAYVMHEVAELPAAERVIAEILDDGTTVGVGMRFPDLIGGQCWKPLEQEGLNITCPD